MKSSPVTFLRSWLGASLVLFAFSERLFWSFWREGDSAQEFLITYFAYSLIAGWSIHAIRKFRVSTADGFFLIGALVGWLAEGVLVNTVYGDGTNPFPLSISFTGLSWHALISVMVGWYWLPKVLATGSNALIAKWMVGLGIGWGLWACYVPTEAPKHPITVSAFATHSFFVIAMLAIGTAMMSDAPVGERKMDSWKFWGISAITLAMFGVAWVPIHHIFALIVLGLFALTLVALRRSRPGTQLTQWVPKIDLTRIGWFGLTYACAVAVYAIGSRGGTAGIPTNFALYALTMPAGFFFWIRALIRARRINLDQPRAEANA